MRPLTRAQRLALHDVYHRDGHRHPKPSYLAWRRTARRALDGCVMVPWCDMWLGIEPDGYTHS